MTHAGVEGPPMAFVIFGKDGQNTRENVEKRYSLEEIELDSGQKDLLEHSEWVLKEISARANIIINRIFESSSEVYGGLQGEHLRTYRELGTTKKLLHYLRNKRDSEREWVATDIKSVARALDDTMKELVYNDALHGRTATAEELADVKKTIDDVREQLVADLAEIEKKLD